jgi:hypothetical protein
VVTTERFKAIAGMLDIDAGNLQMLQMLEIYNEQVRDLFAKTNCDPAGGGLKIRMNPKSGVLRRGGRPDYFKFPPSDASGIVSKFLPALLRPRARFAVR